MQPRFTLKFAFAVMSLVVATNAKAATPITLAEATQKVSGEAEGVIKGVDAEEHKVRIDHGPIVGTLAMAGMVMAFKVAPSIDLSTIKTGDKVKFTVTRDEKGLFLIEKMTPVK
ncbi:MAG: copper-binding protein [Methylocystis sp.]|nr:copper-binding protein [Methylocystis sp.]